MDIKLLILFSRTKQIIFNGIYLIKSLGKKKSCSLFIHRILFFSTLNMIVSFRKETVRLLTIKKKYVQCYSVQQCGNEKLTWG